MTDIGRPQVGEHALQTWDDFLELLAGAADVLALTWHPDDAYTQQQTYRLLLHCLAQGILNPDDPERPDLVPMATSIGRVASTSPDFVYLGARISGTGTYRLSGWRGTSLFVQVNVSAWLGAVLDGFELDDLDIEADGAFEVVLSGHRPTGYGGNWRHLDPQAAQILIRQAAYDWEHEVDGRFAIDRLDVAVRAGARDAAALSRQLGAIGQFVEPYARRWIEHTAELRRLGANRLMFNTQEDIGGVPGQWYCEGTFGLQPAEALILQTSVPDPCRYWSIQLADSLWNGIDWLNAQSHLNGHQARLDGDGCFRAVMSAEDPGVPNWLDTGGHLEGTFIGRWYRPSSMPTASLTKVPLATLRDHLPPDTPLVEPDARQAQLRVRRRAAQLRRRW
jgi:hypothetical protein